MNPVEKLDFWDKIILSLINSKIQCTFPKIVFGNIKILHLELLKLVSFSNYFNLLKKSQKMRKSD